MIRFGVLGPLEVSVDGVPVQLPGARSRGLLVALLLEPHRVVPTTRLVEMLWGDEPPEAAGNALQQLVSRLRTRLGPASEYLTTRPPGYALRAPAGSVDAAVFESRCRAARSVWDDDPVRALETVEEALALWRGPAYGEFAETFARPAAVRLEDLRVSAQEDRAALLLATGMVTEAVAAAHDLLATHPLRERPVEILMRSLHAAGRTTEALAAFRDHREALADEAGLDPGAALSELEGEILRDEAARPAARRSGGGAAPATAEPRPAHPLPWLPGPMIGRESDAQLLGDCLGERRLVTLVGPGGVGKTRLALDVAHDRARHGVRVWWADLSSAGNRPVVEVVAEATGAEMPPSGETVAALAAALGPSGSLLCLDNAETVLADTAHLVEGLVHLNPAVTVLATSRERLAIGDEHVHQLAPLPLPTGADPDNPAVRLFLARAPGIEDGALDDAELELVGAICRRLDGLPLAIELGAAHAPMFGLAELATRVDGNLDLLAGGRRTAAQRHHTLRAVVDWSYGLLTPTEATLFARLAVFPSAFSADQATAVCHGDDLPPGAVAPALARLAEQSMVQASHGRFWLLDTLRAFATGLLDAEQARVLRRRHAEDTADRLSVVRHELGGPDEAAAVEAMEALMPDLHAAWDHAVQHDRGLAVRLAAEIVNHAYQRGRPDLLAWGTTVAGWDIDHPHLPSALGAAAAAAWISGRLDEAERLAVRGVEIGAGSPHAAGPLMQLGNVAMFTGRNDEALEAYRRTAEILRAAGSDAGALVSEVCVAQVLAYSGRADEAQSLAADLVRRAEELGHPTSIAWARFVLGESFAERDYAAAVEAYHGAIEAAAGVRGRFFLNLARSSLVGVVAQQGPVAATFDELGRILDEWEDLGNEALQWWVLLYLAVLLGSAGLDEPAARLAGAVLASKERHPMLPPQVRRLEDMLAALHRRHPDVEADLAAGATLGLPGALALGRAAIRSAAPASGG